MARPGPKVVRTERGADEWTFQGAVTSTAFGISATVGWPSDEWGFKPATLSEMRPGCFITDPSGLKLRKEIGLDVITWECDYPHTDTTWPTSPEHLWKELQASDCTEDEIDKITWRNACRFFDWDPFACTPREQAEARRGCGHRRRRGRKAMTPASEVLSRCRTKIR